MRVKKTMQSFKDRQPDYRYDLLGNEKASVMIFKYVGEAIQEGDEESSFLYDTNNFIVNKEEITEEMIAADPLSWIDFDNLEPTFEEQVITALNDIGEVLGGLL